MILVYGLLIFVVLLFAITIPLEASLDWTKKGELLLWYSEVTNNKKERKFIVLFKK